jgi:RNA polymerase sigma-70 factor (ECF subfamily)
LAAVAAGGETARLLRATLEGEAGARADLLERLRPRIVLWAGSRLSEDLRARIEPEDVAQEVLIAVHDGLDEFRSRDGAAFLPWLFTVAENRIRDMAKRFRAKKRRPVEPVPTTQTSPSSAAARKERLDRMLAAIARLPEPHQEILRLRSIEERSYEEITGLTGRSLGASRVLHCRALAALRAELERFEGPAAAGKSS